MDYDMGKLVILLTKQSNILTRENLSLERGMEEGRRKANMRTMRDNFRMI